MLRPNKILSGQTDVPAREWAAITPWRDGPCNFWGIGKISLTMFIILYISMAKLGGAASIPSENPNMRDWREKTMISVLEIQ